MKRVLTRPSETTKNTNMNTTLSSATFTATNLTVDSDGNVYRFVRSFTNGACEAELIGDLTDITEFEHAALVVDDSARCVVARSFAVNDRVVFTDEEGTEHQANVLRVDGTLLLAFDDGEEGWESAAACRAVAR